MGGAAVAVLVAFVCVTATATVTWSGPVSAVPSETNGGRDKFQTSAKLSRTISASSVLTSSIELCADHEAAGISQGPPTSRVHGGSISVANQGATVLRDHCCDVSSPTPSMSPERISRPSPPIGNCSPLSYRDEKGGVLGVCIGTSLAVECEPPMAAARATSAADPKTLSRDRTGDVGGVLCRVTVAIDSIVDGGVGSSGWSGGIPSKGGGVGVSIEVRPVNGEPVMGQAASKTRSNSGGAARAVLSAEVPTDGVIMISHIISLSAIIRSVLESQRPTNGNDVNSTPPPWLRARLSRSSTPQRTRCSDPVFRPMM
eukprot:m.233362 g.233362  ORF g.233362 m.233362 type:complete len:315 (+) comp26088_c2_seq2:601-1545(+)